MIAHDIFVDLMMPNWRVTCLCFVIEKQLLALLQTVCAAHSTLNFTMPQYNLKKKRMRASPLCALPHTVMIGVVTSM